jgi:glutathione S-transferase
VRGRGIASAPLATLSLRVTLPRIVLYGPPFTPYTVKVQRALALKKLPFELVVPGSQEDYRRWSPETGLLPVLEVEGRRVQDSTRILDFLDERFPEPALLSSDPRVAREQRGLEVWISETFDFYVMRWIRARFAGAPRQPASQGPLGPMSRLGLIGPDGRLRPEVFDTSAGGPGPEFERRLDDLVRLLGPRPYFFADRPSRADLAVLGSCYTMHRDLYPGGRALLEARPALLAHVDRMLAETGGTNGEGRA